MTARRRRHRCLACDEPFARTGRQVYCSPRCADLARQRRHRGRAPVTVAERGMPPDVKSPAPPLPVTDAPHDSGATEARTRLAHLPGCVGASAVPFRGIDGRLLGLVPTCGCDPSWGALTGRQMADRLRRERPLGMAS